MEAELGAHEDDGPVHPGAAAVGARELLLEPVCEGLHPLHQRGVALGGFLRRGPEVVEERDRVLAGARPALGVDVAEDCGAVACPAPAVVVGDSRERLQPVDETLGEELGAGFEVCCPGDEDAAWQALSSITVTRAAAPLSGSCKRGETAGVRAIADQYSDGARDDGIALVDGCDGGVRDLYR